MSHSEGPTLQELLAPLDVAAFRERHLGRHAVKLPARDLGDLARIDPAVLATPRHVDVIRGGVALPFEGATPPTDQSFRLRRVQLLDDRVERFAHRLAAALGEEINVNLYLSPGRDEGPEVPGLAPHRDPYDLFVVQLAGSKRWALLGDVEGRLADEPITDDGALTFGTRGELVLEAGEILYLPRGVLHRVHNAGSTPSTHLAVAILVKTMRSCIDWLATELERRLDPDRPLPLGAERSVYDATLEELAAATAAILTDPARAEAFLAHREVVEYEGMALSPADKSAKPRR